MNFGTSGYGTGQIFLQYSQEGIPLDLDIVFYVYCNNDLRNINENGLFQIDSEGRLKTVKYVAHPFVKGLNKLYITYLMLDVNNGLKDILFDFRPERYMSEHRKRFHAPEYVALEHDFAHGSVTSDVNRTLRIYFAILSRFEEMCKANKTKLYIATIPDEDVNNMAHLLVERGFKTINLYDKFRTVYRDGEYKFKNDAHWNEEGNKFASIFLFQYLAEELGIEYPGNEFIEQGLYEYYSSFSPSRVTSLFLKKHHDFPPTLNHDIRNRYLELEKPDEI